MKEEISALNVVRFLIVVLAAATAGYWGYERWQSAAEAKSWLAARADDRIESYKKFLDEFPDGTHSARARKLIDELTAEQQWELTKAEDTEAAFEDYSMRYPESPHIEEAKVNIERIRWQNAVKSDSIRQYSLFLGAYPGSHHAKDVQQRIEELKKEDRPFTRAVNIGTKEAFEEFLRDYPGHYKRADARTAIVVRRMRAEIDSNDYAYVHDLLENNNFGVEIRAKEVNSIHMEAGWRKPVFVPAGTVFEADNERYSDMVATESIPVNAWLQDVPAALVDISKRAPNPTVGFSIGRFSEESDVARVAYELSHGTGLLKSTSWIIRQLAVWIAAGDPKYETLQDRLYIVETRKTFGPGGEVDEATRVIRATPRDFVLAMIVCKNAGVDITRKAIWRDRDVLARGTKDAFIINQLELIERFE